MDEDEMADGSVAGNDAPSIRSQRRLRRRVAGIVEGASRDLHPGAPIQQIRRLADARCAAAGLPAPSRHAFAAKIAEVRRFDHRPKMIVLDHCIIETSFDGQRPVLCTLHVAILHPPGVPLVWRLIGGPADPAIDAELLVIVQGMSEPYADARVRLDAGGPIGDRIRASLEAADVETVGRPHHGRGVDAGRILVGLSAPYTTRLRAPRAVAGATWATPTAAEAVRGHVAEIMGGPRWSPPPFGLAAVHRAPKMLRELGSIADAGRRPGPSE